MPRCLGFWLGANRFHDLASALDEALDHRAQCSILQHDDCNGPRRHRHLYRQPFQKKEVSIVLRDNLDETGATIWMRRGDRVD